MPTGDRPLLTVYSRLYCHLCEDMLQALRGLQPALGFELEVIDIDAEPALAERYGRLVPVLNLGEKEVCHYFLDENALRTCLAGA